jgi:hypothetical protein
MKKAGSIGAGLDTVFTTNTIFRIYEGNPVFGPEGGPSGANLNARRIITLITEFGNKKASKHPFIQDTTFKSIHSTVGAVYNNIAILVDHISLDPCPEIKRKPGHIILLFARIRTPAASDTFFYVYPHPPGVNPGIIFPIDIYLLFTLRSRSEKSRER